MKLVARYRARGESAARLKRDRRRRMPVKPSCMNKMQSEAREIKKYV